MSGSATAKAQEQKKTGRIDSRLREQSSQPETFDTYAEILALQQNAGNQAVHGLIEGSMPPVVQSVINSGGQPLEPGLRSQMESRFGQDFSQVRVHTDGPAAVSAQAVHAKAYTIGSNVVFSENRYAPETTDGKHLLAHELAHVVQQTRGGAAPAFTPNSSLEQAADQAGHQVAHGHGPVEVSGASAVGIARAPEDPKDRKVTTDVNIGTPAPTKQTDPAAQAEGTTNSSQARLEELQKLLAENQTKLEAAKKMFGRQGGEVARLDGERKKARLPADRLRLTKEKEEAVAKKFVLEYQVRQLTFEKLRLQEEIADIKRPAPVNRQAAGREFEKENVQHSGLPRNFRKFRTSFPGPDAPDGNRIPDYVAKYGDKGEFVALRKDESLNNADFISDSKLLGKNITLTAQVRGFIELAGQTKQKAFLILAGPGAQISEGVRDFARNYGVTVAIMTRDPRQQASAAGGTVAAPTQTPSTAAQTAPKDTTATAPKTATAQMGAITTQTAPPTGTTATASKTASAQTPAITSTDTAAAAAPKVAAPSIQAPAADPKAAATQQGKVRIEDGKAVTISDKEAAKSAGATGGSPKRGQPQVRVRVGEQATGPDPTPSSPLPPSQQKRIDSTAHPDALLLDEPGDLESPKPLAQKTLTAPTPKTQASRTESSTPPTRPSSSPAKATASAATAATPALIPPVPPAKDMKSGLPQVAQTVPAAAPTPPPAPADAVPQKPSAAAPIVAKTAPPQTPKTRALSTGTRVADTQVPTAPPQSSGAAKIQAAAGALQLAGQGLAYLGNIVQSKDANEAYQRMLPAIEELQASTDEGVWVHFVYEAQDPHPDSAINPVPNFSHIELQVGSQSNKKLPATLGRVGSHTQINSMWKPPGQHSLKTELNELWSRLKVMQNWGEREVKRTFIGRFLQERKGDSIDIKPIYDARAHLVSARIALEQNRPGAAEESMKAADALLDQMMERIEAYTGQKF